MFPGSPSSLAHTVHKSMGQKAGEEPGKDLEGEEAVSSKLHAVVSSMSMQLNSLLVFTTCALGIRY